MKTPLVLAALLVGALSHSRLSGNDEALARLTRGGGTIEPGNAAPGLFELTGDEAFPLLRDGSGAILAAGGTHRGSSSEGRMVAFAHDGFLRHEAFLSQASMRDLLGNAVRWCGGSDRPEVAIHPELAALAAILEEAGFTVSRVAPAEVSRRTVKSVYLTVAQRGFEEAGLQALGERLAEGIGLILAATPWPFAGDYPDFATFPANRLAAPAGLRFLPGGTASRRQAYPVSHTDSASVLAAIEGLLEGPLPESASERARLAGELRSGSALRGPALERFLGALRSLNHRLGPIVPTPDRPLVRGEDPLVDAVVDLETSLNLTLPSGKMYPLPAAADYPGPVPDKTPRIERTLTIDGTWKGWLPGRGAGAWAAKEMRPTGLYAAPAEVVTVTVPPEIVGRGFEVVIGAYGGSLENRELWQRYPRLQRSVPIESPETRISNALGGLVTIRVPRGAQSGPLSFTLSGAVAAPVFVAGSTDLAEWRAELRKAPAPWAELVGRHLILALPSSAIRELDDPDKVLETWDEIILRAAELCGGVERSNYRAERIVFERQTSAGYMHSGYPVAAPQDKSLQQAVDAHSLRTEGNWGFFHEYGHNHQHDLWALPGTVETTCNLWSVYLFEEWVGKPRAEGHDSVRPLDRRQRERAYFDGGANFERDWSMWTALESYLQVQETFGWEPFRKVFAEYNGLPEAEWPRTQQEKNDQWVLRLSRACGRNLAPFWASWNLPLSDNVASALAELPAWSGPGQEGPKVPPGPRPPGRARR